MFKKNYLNHVFEQTKTSDLIASSINTLLKTSTKVVVLDLEGQVGALPTGVRFGDPIIVFDSRTMSFGAAVAAFMDYDDLSFKSFDDLLGANISDWDNFDFLSIDEFANLQQDTTANDGYDYPPKDTFLGLTKNYLTSCSENSVADVKSDGNQSVITLENNEKITYAMKLEWDEIEFEFVSKLVTKGLPSTTDEVDEAWKIFRFHSPKQKTR